MGGDDLYDPFAPDDGPYDPFDPSPLGESSPGQAPSFGPSSSPHQTPPTSPTSSVPAQSTATSPNEQMDQGELNSPSPSQPVQVSTFCQSNFHAPPTPSGRASQRRTAEEKVTAFWAKGCGCKRKCSEFFDIDHYRDNIDQCSSLTKDELDLVLLGQIMANISSSSIVGPRSRHAPTPRKTAWLKFHHHGQTVCRTTFLMLHGVGKVLYYE